MTTTTTPERGAEQMGTPAPAGGRTCLVRGAGNQLVALEPAELDGLGERARDPEQLLWLDIDTPSAADVELLSREIGVHPLAIEDLERRGQRPKLDIYPEHSVVVTYDIRRNGQPPSTEPTAPAGSGEAPAGIAPFDFGEIHVYVGPSFLVSVHWGASPALHTTQARFRANAAAIGSGVGTLLYTILDAVVDGYFPVVDEFSDEIDDLADRIVERSSSRTLREVLAIKRRLLELRRVLAPQREVANALLRRDTASFIEERALPYFQDLYDHLLRVLDSVDLYRDLLAATLDTQVSVTSNNLNVVMRRLTAVTVLLMVPTLIAGVYGMNFENMQQPWPTGSMVVVFGTAALIAAMGAFFWLRRWL